jgi:hypothetical protein
MSKNETKKHVRQERNLYINQLKDEIELLKKQRDNYANKVDILMKIKESATKTNDKINFLKSVGEQFSNRVISGLELFNSIKDYIKKDCGINLNGGISGSFVRQLFELPFSLAEEFQDESFGNPKDHDIDIVLSMYNNNIELYGREEVCESFIKYCNELDSYIKYHNLNQQKVKEPKIGTMTIISILDITITTDKILDTDAIGKKNLIDIPHYIIKTLDNNNKLVVFDIMAYFPSGNIWPSGDFDCNSLILTNKGIQLYDNYSESTLSDILYRISKKEAKCLVNFEKIQDIIFSGNLTRNEKIPYYKQIGFFFANRAKLLAYGYNKLSSDFKIPKYLIENNEDCFVTCCKPPYINMVLKCGHKLSVMAYMGELTKGKKEFSEVVQCPYCRADLAVNLEEVDVSKINTFNPKVEIMPNIDYIEEDNKYKQKIFSEDSMNFLKEMMINKNNEVPDNSDEIIPHSPSVIRYNRGLIRSRARGVGIGRGRGGVGRGIRSTTRRGNRGTIGESS